RATGTLGCRHHPVAQDPAPGAAGHRRRAAAEEVERGACGGVADAGRVSTNQEKGGRMLFTFIDRIVVPALIAIFLCGGVARLALGCALVPDQGATLRFMTRMNRWVSTQETFAGLDKRIDLEPAARADRRRPTLCAPLA